MKKTMLMASALMFGVSLPAWANDSADYASEAELNQKVQEKFTDMDTNRNGSISWSEADAADKSREDFNAADANKDGALSLAELRTWKQKEWHESRVDSRGGQAVNGSNDRMREDTTARTTH